jgi:hypothetical protein
MRCVRTLLSLPALWLFLTAQALAGPFVVFPKARQLESPGHQFILFDQESDAEFGGTFHTLWLKVAATGESRKFYDYIGTAAVTWQDDDHLVITEYLSRRTSRSLLLSVSHPTESIMIDVPMLIRSVPSESRDTLRQNDHVFVEALRVETDTFHLRVWGYGQHDPQGFRWNCEYGMTESRVYCSEEQRSK